MEPRAAKHSRNGGLLVSLKVTMEHRVGQDERTRRSSNRLGIEMVSIRIPHSLIYRIE